MKPSSPATRRVDMQQAVMKRYPAAKTIGEAMGKLNAEEYQFMRTGGTARAWRRKMARAGIVLQDE